MTQKPTFEQFVNTPLWTDAKGFFQYADSDSLPGFAIEAYQRFKKDSPEKLEEVMEKVRNHLNLYERHKGLEDHLRGTRIYDVDLRAELAKRSREEIERERNQIKPQLDQAEEELIPLLYEIYIEVIDKQGFDITSIN